MRRFPLAAVLAVLATCASAQEDIPGTQPVEGRYSPYPGQDFPNQAFFGDTHLHTSYSADAGMVGNVLGPDAAYRFAKGEIVTSSTGVEARLARPLDFLVVADHAENLGLAPLLAAKDEVLLSTEFGRQLDAALEAGDPAGAWSIWSGSKAGGVDPLADHPEIYMNAWAEITAAAEAHNAPRLFTALIGFEWTSNPGRNNLHRNVIFRGDKEGADRIIPFSNFDSFDPEDLWAWMERAEEITGQRLLAIPHNGNLSNGLMFDEVRLSGEPFDTDYFAARARWEPLYEVTQMKGDGETHPLLSPDDAFADFETWDKGQLGPEPKTPEMLPREYARMALRRGLAYEADTGVNPFKFGIDRLDRLAHLALDDHRGQLLRQGLRRGADGRSDPVPRNRGRDRRRRERRAIRVADVRLGPRRRLGAREHPRRHLGRAGPQGGLCDHGHPNSRAGVRRLRLRGGRSSAVGLRRAWL